MSAKGALQPYRNYIENRFFPNPFGLIGVATWTDNIAVVDDMNSKRVPHIRGFRMSFRTDAVRQVGFDETLGYGVGYAYHEDLDVSLRVERLDTRSFRPKALRSATIHSRGSEARVTIMGFAPSPIAHMSAGRLSAVILKFIVSWSDT